MVLCVFSSFGLLAKDLDFSTSQPCNSYEQEYAINFNNAGSLEWIIEGGEIVKLDDGKYPENLLDDLIGVKFYPNTWTIIDWSTVHYTRIKFYGFIKSNVSVTYKDPYGRIGSESTPDSINKYDLDNPLKKITVRWDPNYNGQKRITCIGSGLGLFGFDSGNTRKDITFPPAIHNFALISNNPTPFCNDVVTIAGAPSGTINNWAATGANVGAYWGTGFNCNGFNKVGPVTITVAASNDCYTVVRSITLNVTQPDFGHVTQNGNIVDEGNTVVVPNCQGSFNLAMPWVSSSAAYKWELPGNYNNQTNTYDRNTASGRDVTGRLPEGAYTDFVGKVTLTGLCGPAVVKTFIVRPGLMPSVDADIYSCSNSVVIKVNNPNGNSPINAWVTSARPGGWASFTNTTSNSTTFTASNAGDFEVAIQLTDANGCNKRLQTTVHAGEASYNTNTGTAGWQSGVLSDNRVKPGSNLAVYSNKIYFAGRDGKMYFYSYSDALQKWIINQIPGITNVAIPGASNFNKIGIATVGTATYLFYTDNAGFFMKVDLSTYNVSPGIGIALIANDIVVSGNEMYVLGKSNNVLYYNTAQTSYTLFNSTLKTIVPGYGVNYIQNNNLYLTTLGQLTFTNDVNASSDVVVYNGYVYFARGQKGTANIFRFPLNNTGAVEQITTTGNLSGVFTINPVSGVIYYGILDKGALNSTSTVTSGAYKSANIYQAYQQNGSWKFNAATLVKPGEKLDMYIQSPVYAGNHLYYIGAGGNEAIGSNHELEVWNLYYENACAPAIQRIASEETTELKSAEISVYPNPFADVLQLDLSMYSDAAGQQTIKIVVLDAAGKEIYTTNALSELSTINTSDWSAGIYMIKVTCNNKSVIKKAIKI